MDLLTKIHSEIQACCCWIRISDWFLLLFHRLILLFQVSWGPNETVAHFYIKVTLLIWAQASSSNIGHRWNIELKHRSFWPRDRPLWQNIGHLRPNVGRSWLKPIYLISVLKVTVMLVTSLFWWLKTGEIVTETICGDLISVTKSM